MHCYAVAIHDRDPTLGGKTEILRYFSTHQEACWYGEREVSAGRKLGIGCFYVVSSHQEAPK